MTVSGQTNATATEISWLLLCSPFTSCTGGETCYWIQYPRGEEEQTQRLKVAVPKQTVGNWSTLHMDVIWVFGER